MSIASSIFASIAARPTWRRPPRRAGTRFVGVDLPNATVDNIGVATPWVFPGQAGAPTEELAAAERKADDMFMSLLARFTNEGRRVSASPSASYAPIVFAKERAAKAARVGKTRPGRSHAPAVRGQAHPGRSRDGARSTMPTVSSSSVKAGDTWRRRGADVARRTSPVPPKTYVRHGAHRAPGACGWALRS